MPSSIAVTTIWPSLTFRPSTNMPSFFSTRWRGLRELDTFWSDRMEIDGNWITHTALRKAKGHLTSSEIEIGIDSDMFIGHTAFRDSSMVTANPVYSDP